MTSFNFGYDFLNFHNDKEILKQIGSETIIYTNKIHKISSSFSIKHERNLMLTNESIYVFHNKKFKRKLKYEDIKGITFSTMSNDFIIHGIKEYDIHFSHPDKIAIIYVIIIYYEKITKKPLILCEDDEKKKKLSAYVTTKKDKKKDPNFSRMDESKAIDTQTFIIDNEPTETNKRSNTVAFGGKMNIKDVMEEYPTTIKTQILFSNDEKLKFIDLKNFNIIKIIGKGNLSKIFLAECKNNKEYYALKTIPLNIIEDNSSITQKVDTISNINHPFIMSVIFCFETNERLYLGTPYIQGEELSYHIKANKNFNEEKVKFYAASLILALDYLHKNEIIYRNFIPSNVIIDKDGYIKLTPCHLEHILKMKNEILSKIEKNEYTSPECLSDNCSEDAKGGDYWNLGVVIFEMIYGIPPFFTDDPNELNNFIQKTELKFPKNPPISDTAKDLIKKLLNKKSNERLGYNNGFEEIKSHNFFKDFNFEDLLNKTMKSPYIPKIGDILEDNKKIEIKYTYEDLLKNGFIYTN
jgi:hypothetical protein